MHTKKYLQGLMLIFIGLLASTLTYASGLKYEVSITNITKGISFTPFLVAAHRGSLDLFELGYPASESVVAIAEGGNTMPLADELKDNPKVSDIVFTEGLLGPGETVKLKIMAGHGARQLSLAAMLLPTNDTFVALEGIYLPRGRHMAHYKAMAYDAGSELNDESCANIPGPTCGGAGPSDDDGEGFVYFSPGIHGEGDLSVAKFNWDGPVLYVKVKRVH